jgi:hypothetical protein
MRGWAASAVPTALVYRRLLAAVGGARPRAKDLSPAIVIFRGESNGFANEFPRSGNADGAGEFHERERMQGSLFGGGPPSR